MEKSFAKRSTGKLVAAAIGATGLAVLGTNEANAGLVIDVRATGVGNGAVLDSSKAVQTPVGGTVTLGVFAQVTGTDGVNNETFNSAYGLLNSAGALHGNLVGGVILNGSGSPGFNDSSHQNGSNIDWDSDGDLDIGNAPTSSSSTGKFFARNATAGGVATTPISATAGEVLIGQFVFTAADQGESTVVNFLRRNNNGANVSVAALWFEDGSTINKAPNTSSYSSNPIGVTIVPIPEPASLGLMALASVGLLGRRRKA